MGGSRPAICEDSVYTSIEIAEVGPAITPR